MITSFILSDLPLAWTGLWGQEFAWSHLGLIGLLIILEGVLSIDNALVLGLLAKRLPKREQKRALTYGLVGAFVFRFIAILTAAYLLKWWIVKLLGGGYLLFVALKHFFFESKEDIDELITVDEQGRPRFIERTTKRDLTEEEELLELKERVPVHIPNVVSKSDGASGVPTSKKFWSTVLVIELTDIAFAIDSILAAMALVGSPPPGTPADAPHPHLWVVILGGILGVVLMRFAAVLFIKLLDRFPRFETAAYLLVTVIGLKLVADWWFNSTTHTVLDFHSPTHPAFWSFWIAMAVCLGVGFIRKRPQQTAA
jgi:YkoY family integral membrane protein